MKYKWNASDLEGKQPPFPVAEQLDNVSLDKMEYAQGNTKAGKPYRAIDFFFSRITEGGRTQVLKDRMFELDESIITPRENMSLAETIKEAYISETQRLFHIAAAYGITPKEMEQALAPAPDFPNAVEKYIELVMGKMTGTPVWLKTVPDKNGYTRVPNYPPFMQPMSDGICTLTYSKWEQKQVAKNQAPQNGVHEDVEGESEAETVENFEDFTEEEF